MRPKHRRQLKIILFWTVGVVLLMQFIPGDILPAYRDLAQSAYHFPMPLAKSDYLTVTLHPSAEYHVNALGYRGIAPTQLPKPAGVKRLLLLGDSFTYGLNLPDYADTYAAQLQALMGSGWEVINAGYRDGTSLDSYYAYLWTDGLALQPDMMVIQSYTGNDALDMGMTDWLTVDDAGAPLSVRTRRYYTDDAGAMLNPELLPWFYGVPGLRDVKAFVALALVGARLTGGRTGGLPPLPDVAIQQHVTTIFQAWAQVEAKTGIPVYVYLHDTALPDSDQTLRDDGVMQAALHSTFPPERYRDDVGAYTEADILPHDGHMNAAGSRKMAARVVAMIGHQFEAEE